jgi:hypothetical protein
MPLHFYKNGNGEEIPITLEACARGLPRTYHAVRKDNGQLITIHADTIIQRYTPEEMATQERERIKALLKEVGLNEVMQNAS